MKNLIVLLTVSVIFLTYSCRDTSSTNGKSENDTAKIKTSEDGTEKLNILIENYNGFSSSAYKEYEDYVKTFGENPEKFKTYLKWYNGGEFHDHTMKQVKNMKEASKLKIYSELDPLISAYQENAIALSIILKETHAYFDMKDYESDNFAKAKQYHSKTLAAYQKFFEVDDMLRHKTDSIQSNLTLAYLTKLKEEGQTLNYLVGMAMNTAEKMLKVTQANEYAKLNTKDLEEAQKNVRVIFDELTQFKNDKPDEFNENHNMSWFYNAFKDFTKSSKALCNRKKENRPFSRGEKMNLNSSSGWMVTGSTYSVLRKYNDLVNRYNSMVN